MAERKQSGLGPRRSADTWRDLIEEWQESGQDLAEFCRVRLIAPSSIRWWRWRLGLSAARGPKRPGKAKASGLAKREWIELAVEAERSGKTPYELRLAGGVVLTIPPDFESGTLDRLLSVLERSLC